MTTTTWADGFGRWHVSLPASPWAKQDALNALAAEILDRAPASTTPADIVEYLETCMIERATNEPGMTEFIEYGIDADLD